MRHTSRVLLWPLCIALSAGHASAQTFPVLSADELQATDPRAFARLLETARPKPVSAGDKIRILRRLPREGEVANPGDAARRKLAALTQLLRATGSDYEIKVIDVPLARIGLFERSVVLISQNALAIADGEEIQALMAHELGHDYLWADHQRASTLGDRNRLKQLELMCDAIAIVILHGLGMDPSRLMTSVERITLYNRKFLGPTIDESGYPTLSERQAFARAVTGWVGRTRSRR